jgi:hypothetical protein
MRIIKVVKHGSDELYGVPVSDIRQVDHAALNFGCSICEGSVTRKNYCEELPCQHDKNEEREELVFLTPERYLLTRMRGKLA